MQKYKNSYYNVAGIQIVIRYPEGVNIARALPSFIPFATAPNPEEEKTIRIDLDYQAPPLTDAKEKVLSDVHQTWGSRFLFKETSQYYITSVQSEQTQMRWKMYSTKDFKQSNIYILKEERQFTTVLSWLIMVAYGQAALAFNRIVLHASVIENRGRGYVFLGKSGTGKSTHSQLWIQNIPGSKLLNDDNPVIECLPNRTFKVSGSPWSGKTACYRNKSLFLQGIVRLEQAGHNTFLRCEGMRALLTVLPSCTALRWNRKLYNKMVDHVENLLAVVSIGELYCLPNAEAAKTCYNGIHMIK